MVLYAYKRVFWALMLGMVLTGMTLLAANPPAGSQGDDGEGLIRPDGVDTVALGDSIDDLAADSFDRLTLTRPTEITPGIRGRVVLVDGAPRYSIASKPGADEIVLIIVFDRSYATAEGVGPNTLVSEAREAYGFVVLERSPELGDREAAQFADGPEGLIFRTADAGQDLVGVYDAGETSTAVVPADARIAAVWIGDETAAIEPDRAGVGDGDDDGGGADDGDGDDDGEGEDGQGEAGDGDGEGDGDDGRGEADDGEGEDGQGEAGDGDGEGDGDDGGGEADDVDGDGEAELADDVDDDGDDGGGEADDVDQSGDVEGPTMPDELPNTGFYSWGRLVTGLAMVGFGATAIGFERTAARARARTASAFLTTSDERRR